MTGGQLERKQGMRITAHSMWVLADCVPSGGGTCAESSASGPAYPQS